MSTFLTPVTAFITVNPIVFALAALVAIATLATVLFFTFRFFFPPKPLKTKLELLQDELVAAKEEVNAEKKLIELKQTRGPEDVPVHKKALKTAEEKVAKLEVAIVEEEAKKANNEQVELEKIIKNPISSKNTAPILKNVTDAAKNLDPVINITAKAAALATTIASI